MIKEIFENNSKRMCDCCFDYFTKNDLKRYTAREIGALTSLNLCKECNKKRREYFGVRK